MLLARHRSLVKPFEPSSCAADFVGPNVLKPAASRSSDQPGDQRRLRADHDEVDLVGLAERDHRGVVGDVERHALGLLRDAGVARRADEPVGQRAGGELPGQRVLASAGAEEENVHAAQALAWRTAATELDPPRPSTASTPVSTPSLWAWFACRHESSCAVVLLFILGLAAPAAAGQYKLENRPEVVFKGGIVHQSPYPQSKRAASVWASDACWRDCKTTCTWKMEYCVGSNDRGRLPAASRCLRPVLPALLPRPVGRPAARILRLLAGPPSRDGRSVVG